MSAIVLPWKKGYRIIFYDDRKIRHIGLVSLERTTRGIRPDDFLVRRPGASHPRKTPTKDLIAALRGGSVHLTQQDMYFEEFLRDLQIPFQYQKICRICLLEDRITQLTSETSIRCGREEICLTCAKKELSRELQHLRKLGKRTRAHIEDLLLEHRDLEAVLAIIQPESLDMKKTLYDRVDAHPVTKTDNLVELPVPREFVDATPVTTLMPVQQLAVESGLLYGKHLLVVAATASGKTFIGELAGLKNLLEGRGRLLFLVPLVALANQKYERFSESYRKIASVSLSTGVSRLNLPETRSAARRDSGSGIIVGTYEGLDATLRRGKTISNIGTVIIDEVQMLEDPDRGHRLDGMIARLKHIAPKAQFIYLSATIGSPHLLAKKLNANLVTYAERPVSLDRHLLFLERDAKIPTIKRLIFEEFGKSSSKGYKGQTIVFTNARSRCHQIADAIGPRAAPYHAGLTSQERREIESKFAKGKLAAVVTTAALAAGVDFPASQVIFDALAMGIEWLTVQEFQQMTGRAGRPDFHDAGRVVILAEPGGSYSRESKATEEEIALNLLRGVMEEVAPVYGMEESSEVYAANTVVARGREGDIEEMNERMVGTLEDAMPVMERHGLIIRRKGTIELSPLGKVMSEHFIGIERLMRIRSLVRSVDDPLLIVADLECKTDDDEQKKR
ncbi:MAG: DEAD/DEAH box helicase [Methanocalculus sp. MSAO_Arc1]|uniref:DEAD/DEAH box helicase n=1 Tax=Methanocalculus TaxID=71151 RepID=UPI000FEE7E5E|nr:MULTISPECIES: DEAD/DEAH box helicase [unclassified Methanocalculus]MCP1662220.1 helicase [Methanocalculus sp. AMF5]RQD81677.1 MAG: DEAD/DEAH box helicase [Methanocalculus sp. MSAO_Arc1]